MSGSNLEEQAGGRKGQIGPFARLLSGKTLWALILGVAIMFFVLITLVGNFTDAFSLIGDAMQVETGRGEGAFCTSGDQCGELGCRRSLIDSTNRCCPEGANYTGVGCSRPDARVEGSVCIDSDQCVDMPTSGQSGGGNDQSCVASIDGSGGSRCCPQSPSFDRVFTGYECELVASDRVPGESGIGGVCSNERQCGKTGTDDATTGNEVQLECVESPVTDTRRCCPPGEEFVGGTERCSASPDGDRKEGSICTNGDQCSSNNCVDVEVEGMVGPDGLDAPQRCCPQGEIYVGGKTGCTSSSDSS